MPARKPPIHVGSLAADQPSSYLSLRQTATALHVSTKSLLRLIRAGLFAPHARLGRAFVFRREAIDRWIAERESMSGVAPRTRTRTRTPTRKRRAKVRR